MFILMVSYDAGFSYQKHQQAETVEELDPEMQRLDSQHLRWSLKDDSGNIIEGKVCAIHESIRTSIRFAVENAYSSAFSECEKKTCEWGEVMDAVPTCINPTGKVVVCRRIVEVKK